MRAIYYFLAGLGVAMALTVSVALIVRNFPADSPALQEETATPATKSDIQPAENAEAAPPPIVTPPPTVTTSPAQRMNPGELFNPGSFPSPGYIGPDRPGVMPPQAAAPVGESPVSESRGVPIGSRLNLTTEQANKLRYVLLTHTIMQSEAPEFPLRIGGAVPPEVSLMPLPREVADVVPGYRDYSYVISQYQIVIVVTERREIDLLIPAA